MTPSRLVRAVSTAILITAASFAGAATTEFRVFFDSKPDTAADPGCTLGGMSGVDQVLVTQVTDLPGSTRVTRTHRQICTAGALGAPTDIDESGWDARFASGPRELTFETRIPLSAFGPNGITTDVRLGFEATRSTSTHTALWNDDGLDVTIPAPPVRRRAVGSPGTPRTIVLDGALLDWQEVDSSIYGIASEGTREIRMLRVFAWGEPFDTNAETHLFFAVVARLSSDDPYADDDLYTRRQGQGLSISGPGVLANDGDPFHEDLDAELVTEPKKGSVALNEEEGGFTYSPDNPQSKATDSFEYKVKAGSRESNVARVKIKVDDGEGNEPPSFTAGGDVTVEEDSGSYSAVWATAVSPGPLEESQTVSFTVTNDDNGLFSTQPAIAPDGTLTFRPRTNDHGSATVTVQLTDSEGASTSNVTFTITVTPVNDAPTFTEGANQTVAEDAGPQTVNPWATAIKPGPTDEGNAGQTVSFNVTNNTNPSLFSAGPSISPTGVLTYTPAPNANGSATISITLTDTGTPAATSATEQFTITVTPVNDNPFFTAGGNVSVDEDSGAFSATWATGVSAGPLEPAQTVSFTVTNDNNGLFAAQPGIAPDGTLTFTPALNASGSATVSVTLFDNLGGSSAPAVTFTINVTLVNDPPTFALAGNQVVNEDAGLQTVPNFASSISVGPANESAQTITSFNVTNDNNALFSTQPAIATNGTLTYAGNADMSGMATVTVTATDSDGATSSPAQTFNIVINAVNDEPSFTIGGDPAASNEDAGLQTVNGFAGSVSAGPPDESGQTLTFSLTPAGTTGGLTFSTGPVIDASGNLTYTATAEANGTATFDVVLTDSGSNTPPNDNTSTTASFTITVTAVNDPPTFNLGGNQSVNEDAGLQTVNGFASSISVGPANESAQTITSFNVTNDNNALFSQQPAIDTSGNLTYQSNANLNGMATVSVTATDSGGATSSPAQTFIITVNAVNDEPSFAILADPPASNEDAGLQTVNGLASSISAGPADESAQTLTFSLTPTGTTGDLAFSTGPSIDSSGNLTYTATANTNGTASFNGVLTDSGSNTPPNDNTSATVAFTITVNAVNDPPTFNLGADQTVNEDAGLQTVNGFASSISVGPANESAQTITSFNVTNDNNALFAQQPAIDTSGNLTYQTNANLNGMATVSVTATDSGGATSSPAQTFVITVDPVNDEPSFAILADPPASNEDAGLQTVNGLASSISAGPPDESAQTLSFALTSTGSTGTLTFSTAPSIDSSGNLTYTATANTNGTASFNAVLTDSGSNTPPNDNTSATVAFTITVNAVNDLPSFNLGGNQSVNEDAGLQTVNGFASSISVGPADESAQTITSFNVTNDNNALFSQQPAIDTSGNLTYTSALNASGMATVSVTATDSGGATSSPAQTFVITVVSVNDAPVNTAPIAAATNEDTNLTFTAGTLISVNDVDAGGGDVQVTLAAVNGTLTLNAGTLNSLSGDGTANIVMTGTIAEVNAVMNGMVFAPTPNSSAAASVSITTNDQGNTGVIGGPQSDGPTTVPITINPINDKPVVTLSGTVSTFTEGGSPVVVDGGMTVSDIDTPTLTQATLTITNPLDGAVEVLAMSPNGFGITASYVAPTLTLTHATGALLADFQTVLQAVTYENTSTDPDPTQRNIDIRVNDGQGANFLSDVVTKTLNIISVNSKPVVTPSGGTTAFTEDGGAVVVDAAVAVNDSDTPTLIEATVTIANLLDSGSELLIAPAPAGGITANYAAPTLTLTHATGGALADFQTMLQGVTYNNTSHDPTSTTRTIEFQLDDGQSVDNVSDVATKSLSVTPINDAPAGTDNTVTTNEETGYPFTVADFGFSDPLETPDDNLLAVRITTLPAAGALTLSGNPVVALQFIAVADITAGNLIFTPAVNGSGSPYTTFTFQVQDDGGTASGGVDLDPSANIMTINVNGVNDAPAGTNNTVAALEDTLYTFTAANLGFTDPDDTPANVLQSVLITTLPGLGTLTLGGSGFAAGTEITVAQITAGDLKFLAAANASGVGYTTFTFQVRDDGGTANSGVDLDPTPNTLTIDVGPVNDAPVGVDSAVTGTEDIQYTFLVADFGFTDPTDVPANTLQSVVITTLPGAGSIQLSAVNISAGADITLAQITGGLLKFVPVANAFGTPYTTFTFQVRDNGGIANGGVNLDPTPNTMTVNINPVNDAPVAGDDAFDTIGNTELRIDLGTTSTPHVLETTGSTTGVRDDDADPVEGDPFTVTSIVGCLDVATPYDCTLASGAKLSMNANGTFTFIPSTSMVNGAPTNDTFDYVITDQPSVGVAATDTGTVTIAVYDKVWYVRQGAVGGDGTSALPFGNFDSLDGAGGAGDSDDLADYIFVHNSGSLALSASVPLESGQHVLGEGVGLSINVNLNGNGAPTNLVAAGTKPALTLAAGNMFTIANAIPVEIRGLTLTSSAGNVVDVDALGGALSGSPSLTIAANTIGGAGAEGIDLNMNAATTGTLTLAITSNDWNVAGTHTGNAIDLNNGGGVPNSLRLDISNNTNIIGTGAGASGINIGAGTVGTTVVTGFGNNTIHGNTAGSGVIVTNVSFDAVPGGAFDLVGAGTWAIGASGNGVGVHGMMLASVTGDLSFSDLNIFNSNGQGLTLSSTGAANIAAGTGMRLVISVGNGDINANGGPAVSVSNATIDTQLATLVNTNSSTTGVSLTNVSDSTVSAARFSAGSGSSIILPAGAGGPAFSVSGGNAGITFAGTVTNNSTPARAVSIGTWAGDDGTDDMLFSGFIDENGAGILLNANAGSRAITFSGGMEIDTTTGEGFVATSNTNSGNLHVTGTNDVTSTSAAAVRITNTTIGTSHVTFRNVSSGNATAAADPTNGIVIDTTGAVGSFRVQGTGSAASGGLIQNTTGHAISLNSTLHPQFAWMNIQNIGRSGIDGFGVTNFTINNSTINNVGTAAAGQYEESNIAFNDGGLFTGSAVSGTVSITSNTLTNARRHGIDIENGTGTISNVTIQSNTITSSTSAAASLGHGILLFTQGSTATNAHLTTGTISGNTITFFPSGSGINIAGGTGNSSNNTSSTLGANGTPIAVTGNFIGGTAGTKMGNNAIIVTFNGQVGVSNFNISSNGTVGTPLAHFEGIGISVFMGGSVTGTTTVNSNVIVSQQTILAGSSGIAVQADDGPAGLGTSAANVNVTINNNNVSQNEGTGIRAIARASLATMDVTIQNNTVTAPTMTNRNGIRVDSGSAAGDTTLCLLMTGNTSDGSGVNAGMGIRKQGIIAGTNEFGIVGLAPSPTTGANAAAKVTADNPAGNGTDNISGDNYVNCTQTP